MPTKGYRTTAERDAQTLPPPPPPKPQQSLTLGGWRSAGRYRIRSGLFLFPIVEELRESSDGTFRWKRLPWIHSVEFRRD